MKSWRASVATRRIFGFGTPRVLGRNLNHLNLTSRFTAAARAIDERICTVLDQPLHFPPEWTSLFSVSLGPSARTNRNSTSCVFPVFSVTTDSDLDSDSISKSPDTPECVHQIAFNSPALPPFISNISKTHSINIHRGKAGMETSSMTLARSSAKLARPLRPPPRPTL